MSTKAIVGLIQEMRRIGTEEQAELAVQALAEVSAIQRAAKSIVNGTGANVLRNDDYSED